MEAHGQPHHNNKENIDLHEVGRRDHRSKRSNRSDEAHRATHEDTTAGPSGHRGAPNKAPHVSYAKMPFEPYEVQREMMSTIEAGLYSGGPNCGPPIAVVATEVPTGCGKTAALLSTVLKYQDDLKHMTELELKQFHAKRRFSWRRHRVTTNKQADTSPVVNDDHVPLAELYAAQHASNSTPFADGDEADAWDAVKELRSMFLSLQRSINPGASMKRIRLQVDSTASSALRRTFTPPPCTIFFATRTHSQLKQAIRELRKLHGTSTRIRMNILGSRDHYCINRTVLDAKAKKTLTNESNHLGNVCDMLVSMGQCASQYGFDELACQAAGGFLNGKKEKVWDLEDLVGEGLAQSACPYYAARDLVFFADINFCTYPYLLDPIIRHECKMEGAIRNQTIVVFDEAHNVPAVCQEALSVEQPMNVFGQIMLELTDLIEPPPDRKGCVVHCTSTMQYPRQFELRGFTLVQLFFVLRSLFQGLSTFYAGLPILFGADGDGEADDGGADASSTAQCGGAVLAQSIALALRHAVETLPPPETPAAGKAKASAAPQKPRSSSRWTEAFQLIYVIILSLGVSFNPFGLSIFALGHMKRWLVLCRFLLQKPDAFAPRTRCKMSAEEYRQRQLQILRQDPASCPDDAGPSSNVLWAVLHCLDGSLAFNHLLRSVHRVVLASGTLSPFTQLGKDLGLSPSQWRTLSCGHVVPPTRFSFHALTTITQLSTLSEENLGLDYVSQPLRCVRANWMDSNFITAVAHHILTLASTLHNGGVLVFAPNYSIQRRMMEEVQLLWNKRRDLHQAHRSSSRRSGEPRLEFFMEPKQAAMLESVMHDYRAAATSLGRRATNTVALLFGVYRGKVGEGIDFNDEMARLVLCLGVPLQPLLSWKVMAQRAYSGPSWYLGDAVRAVNQALGRCLRHAKDYGAVVLLDERYATPSHQELLPGGVRLTYSMKRPWKAHVRLWLVSLVDCTPREVKKRDMMAVVRRGMIHHKIFIQDAVVLVCLSGGEHNCTSSCRHGSCAAAQGTQSPHFTAHSGRFMFAPSRPNRH